jgi:hypothetical protein
MNNPGPPLNGSKVLWWIVGTVTTLVMGVGAGTFSTLRANSERIAVLESQVADTRQHLQRIERKLDRLLEYEKDR